MTSIAVIGAGMAGLVCANALQQAGAAVTVFEKSRGVGGRMATRRSPVGTFDHGIAMFEPTSPAFVEVTKQLVADGILTPWQFEAMYLDGAAFANPTAPSTTCQQTRYVGAPTMNALAKYLATTLNIQRECKVDNLEQVAGGWRLTQDNQTFLGEFDWVVLAVPVAQAANFASVNALFTKLPIHTLQACSVLMLGFDTPLQLPWQVAYIENHAAIEQIIINSAKPQRLNLPYTTMVVHSTAAWADAHIDADKEMSKTHLVAAVGELLGICAQDAPHQDLHHWRYAKPQVVAPTAAHATGFAAADDHHIALCGDWLLSGDLASAYLSGQRLAAHLLKSL